MPELNIVHVIDRLGIGGAARAVLANAREWQRLGKGRNRIVSLLSAAPAALERARAGQIPVLQSPDRNALSGAIQDADIVQVHYFNSPVLFRFLASHLPACRALLWCHVGGATPSQALTQEVVEWADRLVVAAPKTLSVPCVQNHIAHGGSPRVIIGGADFSRLGKIEPRPHQGFNVGYIGTLDPVKIYPDFVAMCAAIDVLDIRFVVCGAPSRTLQSQAAACSAAGRFDFRGYVEDLRPILEVLDVFGYPLCAENYSSTDQTVQEAMYAGVPPVVFPYGGVGEMVLNDETGLVVADAATYATAVQFLADRPQERARLGRNARAYAETHFGAERCARPFDEVYEELIVRPKRERRPIGERTGIDGETTLSGAELLLLSLGGLAPEFEISAHGRDRELVRSADRTIAQASPPRLASVLHYSASYPRDPLLSLWAGLVFRASGQHARALINFRHALAIGGDERRLEEYISDTAQALGASREAIAMSVAQGKSAKPITAASASP